MGTKRRPTSRYLAKKLRQIRSHLGLSQTEIVKELGREGEMARSTISAFERGVREPSYPVLLAYARLADLSTDALIDDDIRTLEPFVD
jgi:transcriptional regulator with XRE-family HTH domain